MLCFYICVLYMVCLCDIISVITSTNEYVIFIFPSMEVVVEIIVEPFRPCIKMYNL